MIELTLDKGSTLPSDIFSDDVHIVDAEGADKVLSVNEGWKPAGWYDLGKYKQVTSDTVFDEDATIELQYDHEGDTEVAIHLLLIGDVNDDLLKMSYTYIMPNSFFISNVCEAAMKQLPQDDPNYPCEVSREIVTDIIRSNKLKYIDSDVIGDIVSVLPFIVSTQSGLRLDGITVAATIKPGIALFIDGPDRDGFNGERQKKLMSAAINDDGSITMPECPDEMAKNNLGMDFKGWRLANPNKYTEKILHPGESDTPSLHKKSGALYVAWYSDSVYGEAEQKRFPQNVVHKDAKYGMTYDLNITENQFSRYNTVLEGYGFDPMVGIQDPQGYYTINVDNIARRSVLDVDNTHDFELMCDAVDDNYVKMSKIEHRNAVYSTPSQTISVSSYSDLLSTFKNVYGQKNIDCVEIKFANDIVVQDSTADIYAPRWNSEEAAIIKINLDGHRLVFTNKMPELRFRNLNDLSTIVWCNGFFEGGCVVNLIENLNTVFYQVTFNSTRLLTLFTVGTWSECTFNTMVQIPQSVRMYNCHFNKTVCTYDTRKVVMFQKCYFTCGSTPGLICIECPEYYTNIILQDPVFNKEEGFEGDTVGAYLENVRLYLYGRLDGFERDRSKTVTFEFLDEQRSCYSDTIAIGKTEWLTHFISAMNNDRYKTNLSFNDGQLCRIYESVPMPYNAELVDKGNDGTVIM